ncbi:MAG: hypothetical protein BGO78_01435 [Chloroflexi bacterium 44-23]|nr:MAG: hypothetical protein BGO78_01435 [Chloroflexi bacterium 44-23]
MTSSSSKSGKTTIAPEVLVSIAKLTALSVDGVSRLASIHTEVDRFFKRGVSEGIKINVEDGTVYADIYVILNRDYNIRDVSHTIQNKVSRAISEMVGMDVGKINIHVEDIELSKIES